MLNKITGCESRTVPPLYVLMVKPMAKASHWGVPWEGKFERGSSPPQGMSQKTYGSDSPIIRVITDGALVAETRLRHQYFGAAAYLF